MFTVSRPKLSIILIETVFIALLASVFLAVTGYIFSMLADMPQINWGLTARWFNMLAQGQFVTSSIYNEPPFLHESAIGLSEHFMMSLVFSFLYLELCTQHNINKIPPILSGLFFGWGMVMLPIFVQYPSMGIRIFSANPPYVTMGFYKVVLIHSFYGIGLGLGRELLEFLRKNK